MKIKKFFISVMMVFVMVLGGIGVVFVNGNDLFNIVLFKFEFLIKLGIIDFIELEKYGVEYYIYEEYVKYI